MTIKTRKKLIEVALPLEAINEEGSRRKRKAPAGYPTGLHKWWAQRPLAAARAVIFAQMVDDPSEYVDTLLAVPETRRAAERELKKRHALWEARRAEAEAAPDDATLPAAGPEPTLEDCAADLERQKLFRLIEQLVQWENTTNEHVLSRAREEIWQSWRRACADNAGHPQAAELFDRNKLPAFHDPFAGGGSLPLEAQRLGLEAHASDLNPVAVLINKAMIEIPPKFAGRPPVHPGHDANRAWKGAQGLAEDVRHYGKWMRDEAERRIGHLYPKVTAHRLPRRPGAQAAWIDHLQLEEWRQQGANGTPDAWLLAETKASPLKTPAAFVAVIEPEQLTVIAWLWASTVKSPNPAFAAVDVPLASTFMLSTKAGKEAYVEPLIEGGGYRFRVHMRKPQDQAAARTGTKLSRGANFMCVMSGAAIAPAHIYAEANAGRMGARLMAIVAEGARGRVYLSPTEEHEAVARQAQPAWKPDVAMPANPRWFSPPLYGLTTFGDLFTARQLVVLNTFCDLVGEARAKVLADATSALPPDPTPLAEGGTGAQAYADAVAVYLGFTVSRLVV